MNQTNASMRLSSNLDESQNLPSENAQVKDFKRKFPIVSSQTKGTTRSLSNECFQARVLPKGRPSVHKKRWQFPSESFQVQVPQAKFLGDHRKQKFPGDLSHAKFSAQANALVWTIPN